MYVPAAFAMTDPTALHDFMKQHSFAVLTSHGEEGLMASHLPLLLEPGDGTMGQLTGHMARANPHWKRIQGDVLVVYSGPHAYVSPSWYGEEGTVPTWNYVAVHVYGAFHLVEEREPLLAILRRSVQTYEGPRPAPWPFDESAAHVETMLKAIVGFRIDITRIEGKWKLSQNQPEHRRDRVIQGLSHQPDENAQGIVNLMRPGP